jgi:hypothetical protein
LRFFQLDGSAWEFGQKWAISTQKVGFDEFTQ